MQDCRAGKDLGQKLMKKNWSALLPVPGVMERLRGAAELPLFVTVTFWKANWFTSTSPKFTLPGVTVSPATVRTAVAVLPVPPFAEVTAPVMLVYCPEAVAVTGTLNWHWLLGAMAAPARVIVPGVVVVKVPPQAVAVLLVTVNPAGRTSVNATPASATVLVAGLVMVKLSEVAAFTAMELGLNVLAMDGGATTVMLAEAALPLPPSLEVTALVVLF